MLVAEKTEDTAEHSIDSAMINDEQISTADNTLITDQNDPQTFKNEIDKLSKAIDAIKREFEFPANLSQEDALQSEIDEYKLKCAECEVKIQELQQDKASLMESIQILSSDQSVGSHDLHDLQPASDDWQPVTSNKSNNPRRGKKKKGKASSQNQQLQTENNDTSENGQGEQRPNEGTIIVGDSIVKGLRRDSLSRAAKRRLTVRSFPGATTADMEHLSTTKLGYKTEGHNPPCRNK